jgi:hypothetical protein
MKNYARGHKPTHNSVESNAHSALKPPRPFTSPGTASHGSREETDARGRTSSNARRFKPLRQGENRSNLPGKIKAGVEHLSGVSLDDVTVHYNSPEPERLEASSYTKGTHIHLGPGQEEDLPHEAWHVVQQKQGRVRATAQARGAAVNDERRLEREADVMGDRAGRGGGAAVVAARTADRGALPAGREALRPAARSNAGVAVSLASSRTAATGAIQMQNRKNRRQQKLREKWQQRQNQATSIADDPELNVDEETRKELAQIEESSLPQRSRRRKALAPQEERWPPEVRRIADKRKTKTRRPRDLTVEVGAGTGSGSEYLRNISHAKAERREKAEKVEARNLPPSDFRSHLLSRPRKKRTYVATDIAKQGGQGGFLKEARNKGIPVRGGVNANELHRQLRPRSVREVVGANAFGGNQPGASYGLARFSRTTPDGKAIDLKSREFDPRLLQSAHKVLKPGGKVRLFGRSNILRQRTLEKFGKAKKNRPIMDLTSGQKKEAESRGYVTKSVKKPNPYLDATPEMLEQASHLGYAVHVKPIKQDPKVTFKRPDTHPGEEGIPLGEFNTQFVFRKLHGGRKKGGVYYHRQHKGGEADSDVDEESDED